MTEKWSVEERDVRAPVVAPCHCNAYTINIEKLCTNYTIIVKYIM